MAAPAMLGAWIGSSVRGSGRDAGLIRASGAVTAAAGREA